LAIEQIPRGEEVAHGRMVDMPRNGTVLAWSDPTFAHDSVAKVTRGSLQPNKKVPSVCAARIWTKQMKKVGILYFSFVFSIFFHLGCA
jgi:hypothetical protein